MDLIYNGSNILHIEKQQKISLNDKFSQIHPDSNLT